MNKSKEENWRVIYQGCEFALPSKTIGAFINRETLHLVMARSWVDEGSTYMVYPTNDSPPTRVKKSEYLLRKKPCPETDERESEMKNKEVTGYEKLQEVLKRAYDQAANGKGKERHSSNNTIPFQEQRMQTISNLIKSPKGMEYQVVKKITEGLEMEETERTTKELLGAINYIAGIIIFLEKQDNQ